VCHKVAQVWAEWRTKWRTGAGGALAHLWRVAQGKWRTPQSGAVAHSPKVAHRHTELAHSQKVAHLCGVAQWRTGTRWQSDDEVSQSAGTDRGTDGTADTLDRDEVRTVSGQVDVSTVWQVMRCVLHVCCLCSRRMR
jgi:hypothetical protein